MSKVDEFLKSNIFSYHQILKNSMLKQIESNSLQMPGKQRKITTELCFFKNINARTRRQRRQLEYLIQEKMNFIYKDWNAYLKHQYPEIFKEAIEEKSKTQEKPRDFCTKFESIKIE